MKQSPFHACSEVGETIRFGLKPEVRSLLKKYSSLPEPTKDNTMPGGAHALIDMENHFLAHEVNPEQDKLVRGFFKLLIMLYDSDHYWWERIDEAIRYIKEMEWESKYNQGIPRRTWWIPVVEFNGEDEGEDELYEKGLGALRKMRFNLLSKRTYDGHIEDAYRLTLIQRLFEGLPIETEAFWELFGELI